MNATSVGTRVGPRRIQQPAHLTLPEWELGGRFLKRIPRRVLVVDDEPLIRWSVSERLSELGLEVDQASTAADALRAITSNALAFDVVILDLRLPDMSDLSLLGTIRQIHPDTVIVLITAFGADEVVERAIAMGACAVLDKPFELGRLVDAVFGTV